MNRSSIHCIIHYITGVWSNHFIWVMITMLNEPRQNFQCWKTLFWEFIKATFRIRDNCNSLGYLIPMYFEWSLTAGIYFCQHMLLSHKINVRLDFDMKMVINSWLVKSYCSTYHQKLLNCGVNLNPICQNFTLKPRCTFNLLYWGVIINKFGSANI